MFDLGGTSRARPCAPILAALAAFVPAVAAAQEPPPDTIAAEPARGPAAAIDDLCVADPARDEEVIECERKKVKVKGKLKAPYQAIARVDRGDPDTFMVAHLALQLDGNWYLAPLAEWSTDGADHGDVKIKSVTLKDVIPGGAPEILVTGSHAELGESHDDATHGTTRDVLWVCSVGASGAPSCADVTLGVSFVPHPHLEVEKWKVKLRHSFDEDGRIVRKVKGKWPRHARWTEENAVDRADYENTRTLSFP